MTYIGIDYGSKRVGISVSDEEGKMAFPVTVIKNSDELANELKKIAEERKTKEFVIGESKNFHGDDNEVMKGVMGLKNGLESGGFVVYLEPEFMSSAQAVHLQGENEMIDASAATIILQSFLDKRNS